MSWQRGPNPGAVGTCIAWGEQLSFNTKPTARYDGPLFDEYCISEGKYLPSHRDRSGCIPCPLSNLCQAGFEEHVARISRGENPSLTHGCAFSEDDLRADRLLAGLTSREVSFVREKIPSLGESGKVN